MSTSSSEASSGDSSSSGLPDLPDPKYDIGVPDAPEPVTGCTGVDFLFVIDNSGSMAAFQEVVLDSVDAFIAALDSRITGVDSFHFGVVTSDAYALNSAGCQGLGDLVTQTAAGDCGPFADGERFATDADDLTDVLPCMLQVGTMGSPIEEPASAAVAAVSPANALPGACNEGFLRDDAILAVILVTDDPPFDADLDDAHPDTDPSPWAPAILEAKDGEDGAVVVLGFIPWDDVSCVPFGLESPNLIEWLRQRDQGQRVRTGLRPRPRRSHGRSRHGLRRPRSVTAARVLAASGGRNPAKIQAR
jgi:hypothetical protein